MAARGKGCGALGKRPTALRLLGRVVLPILACLVLGLLTTFVIAWSASLQARAGSNIRDGMSWRRRDPARGEGEGWLRAHMAYKPAWRWAFGQAVPPLGYESWTPTDRSPEQAVRGRARALTLPWLEADRPWPAPGKDDMVNLDEYGWPFLALYARTFGMLATDPVEHLWTVRSVGWFARRPLGDLGGLPVGIIWTGLLPDVVLWSLPWLPIFFARRVRRNLRSRRGLCTACGYDREGLASGSPCPECGRAAT